LLACAPARAAIDVFLCIPDIPGESTDVVFANCTEVVSFSDAAFMEAGEPEARDLRLTKRQDSSTLPLRRAFVAGTLIAQATVNFRKASGTGPTQAYAALRLLDVTVTSFATTASSGDDIPGESISLSARRIEYMYRKQQSSGQLLPPTYVCWNLTTNAVTTSQCQ
jgi:type VI protein secretion system component Hcp